MPTAKTTFKPTQTVVATRSALFPKAQGYGISIDGLWYRLAANPPSPLQIGTKDSLAERLDQRGSTDENVLDLGYAFSRNNLTGGEGLDWFPRTSQLGEAQPLDTIRYWDSENLNIQRPDAGNPYAVSLARNTRVFYTPGSTPVDLATSARYIYVAWGQQVDWFDDWQDNTPVGTFDFGADVALVEAGAGDEVYVLTVDGHLWYKPWDQSTFVEVYDLTGEGFNNRPLTNIWLVKDRLLAERVDVAASSGTIELVAGTPVGIGDPVDPTWTLEFLTVDTARGRFRRLIDGGVAIVGIVADGSIRSYVPQADTGGGDPSLTIRGRTEVAAGEEPISIGYGAGVLIVLTTADEDEAQTTNTIRAYSGEVLPAQADYIVGNLQLLRTWRGAAEPPSATKNMPSTRDTIFWTVEEEAGNDHLWSYDTVSTGLHRANRFDSDLTSLILFDSLGGAIIGDDVVVSDPLNYVDEGYLITPNINFGLNTEINWITSILETLGLDGSTTAELYYTLNPEAIKDPDDPTWQLITAARWQSQQGIEIPMSGVLSKSLALMLKLKASSDNSKTPVVTRFSIRAFPSHRDYIIEAPINVSDIISAPGRMPYRLANYGDTIQNRLLNLSGRNVEAVLVEPPMVIRGVVDTILQPIEYTTERGSVGRYMLVRIRGSRITQAGTGIATNQGLGITHLGIGLLGVESAT